MRTPCGCSGETYARVVPLLLQSEKHVGKERAVLPSSVQQRGWVVRAGLSCVSGTGAVPEVAHLAAVGSWPRTMLLMAPPCESEGHLGRQAGQHALLIFDEVVVIPVTFLQPPLALLLTVLHGVTTTHVPVWSRKSASWALVVADKVDVGGEGCACDGYVPDIRPARTRRRTQTTPSP